LDLDILEASLRGEAPAAKPEALNGVKASALAEVASRPSGVDDSQAIAIESMVPMPDASGASRVQVVAVATVDLPELGNPLGNPPLRTPEFLQESWQNGGKLEPIKGTALLPMQFIAASWGRHLLTQLLRLHGVSPVALELASDLPPNPSYHSNIFKVRVRHGPVRPAPGARHPVDAASSRRCVCLTGGGVGRAAAIRGPVSALTKPVRVAEYCARMSVGGAYRR
jgi:hypothetical protein